MADKSGETKQNDEGKPLTDKDLEDVSGGIIVQTPDPIQTPDLSRTGWLPPFDQNPAGSR